MTTFCSLLSWLGRRSQPRFFRFAAFALFSASGWIFYAPSSWAQSAAGSLVTTFDPGVGTNGQVRAAVYQADGKILIGGTFDSVQGAVRHKVARLNADGSLDASFDPGNGANGAVNALLALASGEIVVGGEFSNFNDSSHNGLALLNANGSVDESFNSQLSKTGAGGNPPGFVAALAAAADGEIVVGGAFDRVDDALASGVARLGREGVLDVTYQPNAGVNGKVNAVAVLPNGQILIGGEFVGVDNAPRNGIARLNVDGQLDLTFDPGAGATGGAVQALALQPDGSVVIAGNFSQVAGQPRAGLAKLFAGGGLDAAFAPALNGGVNALAVQSDGSLLIGGAFGSVSGVARNGLARLNTDGSLDAGFDPGSGANGPVITLALTADNHTALIAGSFSAVNGTPLAGLAEINANASDVVVPPVVITPPPFVPVTVAVSADVSAIGRDMGEVATITLSRTGDVSQKVKINYAVVGTAISGVDYAPVTGVQKIKKGKTEAAFQIRWLGSANGGGVVNAKIKLLPGDGYSVVDPKKVKVKVSR